MESKNRVSHLMTVHIGAFTGEKRPPRNRVVKKVKPGGFPKTSVRIQRVQVDATVQVDPQNPTDLPVGTLGYHKSPEIRSPS